MNDFGTVHIWGETLFSIIYKLLQCFLLIRKANCVFGVTYIPKKRYIRTCAFKLFSKLRKYILLLPISFQSALRFFYQVHYFLIFFLSTSFVPIIL